jgi:hypothetical protein
MDLQIHVGLHKTGTTTVQDALFRNRELLARSGILYPSTGLHGPQHALIPGCLIAIHPSLDQEPRSTDLSHYLDALQAEVRQAKPRLTVISSEVFTETIFYEPSACLQLIAALSQLFDRTSILLTRRALKHQALSSLKNMQRGGCDDAIADPIGLYKTTLDNFRLATHFWQHCGLTVHEKHLEAADGCLVDHYFGALFDRHDPQLRPRLAHAIQRDGGNHCMNADAHSALLYLLLLLLGNGWESASWVGRPLLPILEEAMAAEATRTEIVHAVRSEHLIGYLESLAGAGAETPQAPTYVSTSHKLEALARCGLSSDDIAAITRMLNRVRDLDAPTEACLPAAGSVMERGLPIQG